MRKFPTTFGSMGLSGFLALIGLSAALVIFSILVFAFNFSPSNNEVFFAASIGAGAIIGLVLRR